MRKQEYLFLAVSFEDTYPSLITTTQSAYDMNVEEINSEYNLADYAIKSSDDSNIMLEQIFNLLV